MKFAHTLLGMAIVVPCLASSAAAQMNCLDVSHQSGTTMLRNYCNRDINVRWTDGKYCSTGCMAHLDANSRSAVTLWQGHTTYQVCYGYDYPVVNGSTYSCN